VRKATAALTKNKTKIGLGLAEGERGNKKGMKRGKTRATNNTAASRMPARCGGEQGEKITPEITNSKKKTKKTRTRGARSRVERASCSLTLKQLEILQVVKPLKHRSLPEGGGGGTKATKARIPI